MKKITTISSILFGLAFITFGFNFFLNFIPMGDGPPAGSPPALFFGAVGPTGFMTFVKVLEIIGGFAMLIPLTRNLGLLILGPIVVNILAFNIFIAGGAAVLQPPVLAVTALSLILLWAQRNDFLTLILPQPK